MSKRYEERQLLLSSECVGMTTPSDEMLGLAEENLDAFLLSLGLYQLTPRSVKKRLSLFSPNEEEMRLLTYAMQKRREKLKVRVDSSGRVLAVYGDNGIPTHTAWIPIHTKSKLMEYFGIHPTT